MLPALHWLSSQQPLGQLVGVQTQAWFLHSRPAGQGAQVTPPVPQAWLVLPPWHSLFWQQPFAQLVGVHTHWPCTHVWPCLQALPHVPQLFTSF